MISNAESGAVARAEGPTYGGASTARKRGSARQTPPPLAAVRKRLNTDFIVIKQRGYFISTQPGVGRALMACAISLLISSTLLAQKTAPPITRDLDRDGVPDLRDRCRATPINTPVDSNGCPAAVSGAPAIAQPGASQAQPTAFTADQYLQGTVEGRRAAEDVGTGGRMLGGFAAGFFLGLIGTGIAYAIASSDQPELPTVEVLRLNGQPPGFVAGFEEGYGNRVRGRRKSAALTGGLLGTALIVTILLSNYQ